MAQGEVQREASSFMANDIAYDTSGSGGILDNYQSAFLGIAPCTYRQMGGEPDRFVDEYSVPFDPSIQVANEIDPYLSTAHPILPSDSPWSAARPLRVSQYSTGYVAFINGSESPSDKSSYDELPEPHVRHSTTVYQSTQATEMDDVSIPVTAVSTTQHFEWQIDGPSGGISSERMGRTGGEAASGRRGRRNGPLTAKSRQGASHMRKYHACIPCRFRKVKASVQRFPCLTPLLWLTEFDSAQKVRFVMNAASMHLGRGHASDRLLSVMELVTSLVSSSTLLNWWILTHFIDVLTSHLCRGQVESLISENIAKFTDVQTTVKVTCGGIFESMDLTVNIFVNKTDELLYHHRLTTRDESEESEVVIEHSAPVGIIGMDEVLQGQCKSYIKSMVSNPYYVLQVTAGDPTAVCRDVLQVVHDYFLRETEKVC
jgi:hypothetical protein